MITCCNMCKIISGKKREIYWEFDSRGLDSINYEERRLIYLCDVCYIFLISREKNIVF